MAEYERSLILDALDASGWHQRRAAARLGILPTTLLEKMKRPGVALIGRAQEVQWVTMGTDVRRDPDTGCPHYSFKKVDRRVTVYYFYLRHEVARLE